MAISAPGGRRIEILAIKQKINGDDDRFGGIYDGTHQDSRPAGKHPVRAQYDDNSNKQGNVTITAGARAEFTPN